VNVLPERRPKTNAFSDGLNASSSGRLKI